MATEYKLSFTASEIDDRLGMAGNAVLFTQQDLTEEQKAQARLNIGALALEDDKNYETKEVEYSYNGDNTTEDYIWAYTNAGKKAFVKVADVPDGEVNLSGGSVSVVTPVNHWLDYSFDITNEMLSEEVAFDDGTVSASVNGLKQVFYKHEQDTSPITVIIVCTRAGYYNIAFNGWMETINFTEKGIYFLDNRDYGGAKYAESLSCSILIIADESVSPLEYQGNEIQVFSRGICIGDSITQGVFNHSEGEVTIKKYSYPSVLKRITGIDIVNAGVAGLTSKTWYDASLDSDTQYGRWVNNEWVWHTAPEVGESDIVSTALDYSGFDFAIIHLGINDVGMMGDATIEEALATFDTNINNIISKLKTSNNGIKIFLATIIPCYAVGGNTTYETFNAKIREIANINEDVFLIDLNTYSELFDGTVYENSHLTALGYHKMASEIIALINHSISQNLDSFKEVQFIGTEYTIDSISETETETE